jgi:hypothetical protein
MGMSQVLLTGPAGQQLRTAEREHLAIVQKSAELMRSVVNDALDTKKMESGKFEYE